MSALEVACAYGGGSHLRVTEAGATLGLATARDPTLAPQRFLRARALSPEITAKSLRAVSEIVGARFYVPPAMLARILREADPVVTVGDGAVRFEGFSACCSAYARLDLDDAALDVAERSRGTTNVDFGPDLRGELAQVRKDSAFDITVGADAVEIAHGATKLIERKVSLPLRWIRGFGEVQVAMAGMALALTLPRVVAHRFLRSVTKGQSDHLQWISVSGGSPRTSTRQTAGAVPLRGGHRLKVLEALVPHAQSLMVYAAPQGSTAWVLDFGTQRLVLVVNAEPWRGFSGDGGLLSDLATSSDAAVATVRAQLNWQTALDPDGLQTATGLSAVQVQTGLARLAASGLLGFDLASGRYFHRALPYGADRLQQQNPRLKAALALVEAGAVTLGAPGAPDKVASQDVIHELRQTEDGLRCTCPWSAKTKGQRGPCKHALAVEIAREPQS